MRTAKSTASTSESGTVGSGRADRVKAARLRISEIRASLRQYDEIVTLIQDVQKKIDPELTDLEAELSQLELSAEILSQIELSAEIAALGSRRLSEAELADLVSRASNYEKAHALLASAELNRAVARLLRGLIKEPS